MKTGRIESNRVSRVTRESPSFSCGWFRVGVETREESYARGGASAGSGFEGCAHKGASQSIEI